MKKMLNKDQNQEVGNSATAIQAGGSVTVINVGVTASEVMEIASNVSKAVFYELTGTAKETASIRVEEITEQVIKKLEMDYPAGLQKAIDPDFQYALFTVQKEYARSGDKDLGDLLVDLLVDRSKQEQRDILQIVLNESLATAPKLTDSHLAALAVIFLFKYTQNFGVGNHQLFGEFLDKHILPFVSKLTKNQAGYQHLEFTGCGSIGFGGQSLESILGTVYQGQFLKGFDKSEISNRPISVGFDPRFFIPCLNDPLKIQVRANSKENLEKFIEDQGVSSEDKARILELFDLGKMSESEIKEKIITIRPYMADVIETWTNSAMQSFTLTSVGMAIGHANIKRLIGEFANLSIWIN
ncbi:LPO_1073/Vpar_1526 family protein [Geobacter sulfurreducens]|uniref:LPO_1073/Vpar_1526 family protein n=1 Tax=Geobacter sulfurreducens TaxID=35554 RepID=UPI002D1FAA4F|nr:LPO_1073/Vpar_1526 family protein [Geobacter sulfurreducens]